MNQREIRELSSEVDIAPRNQLERRRERTEYHERRIIETVEARKESGDVTLFVNEFHRWSRKNAPSLDERTWLSTPEVMELQWYRYSRAVVDAALERRFGTASA